MNPHEKKAISVNLKKPPDNSNSFKLNVEKIEKPERKEDDPIDEAWTLEDSYDEYCIQRNMDSVFNEIVD